MAERGLGADQVTERMRGTVLRDEAPPGGQVLFGQREKELDRDWADAPSGVDDAQEASGEPESVVVDWADEMVGMERRPPRAADHCPVTDSRRNEPISTLKQEGEACDVCACNPCQCDKLKSTYRVPTEISAPEMKRSGKPHHTRAKPVMGVNSQEARDFRMHSKPRPEHKSGIGGRTADFVGNVHNEGTGSWEDEGVQARLRSKGAHHTGGDEIPLNPDTGLGVARGALSGGRTVG